MADEDNKEQQKDNQPATAATPAAVHKKTMQKARQALEQELQKNLDAKYKEIMTAAEGVDKAQKVVDNLHEEWDELKTETVEKLKAFDERSAKFAPTTKK